MARSDQCAADPFENRFPSEIGLADLEEYCRLHVPESVKLDFKEDLDLDRTTPQEILRDITSLANRDGGYIIFGVAEEGTGRASAVRGVREPERLKSKYVDLVAAHVIPRFDAMDFALIPRGADPSALVLKVERGFKRPYMITVNSATDFWIRHGDRNRTMTFPEIEEAFHSERRDIALYQVKGAVDALRSRLESLATLVETLARNLPAGPQQGGYRP